MKLATMLQDILRSLVRPPATERIASAAPARLRGQLRWSPEQCTGCGLCVKDCPAEALELFRLDNKAKRFVLRYSVDRCTFCGQCVEDCRFGCLTMTDGDWSLAAPTRAGFTIYYGDKADVERVLVEQAASRGETPEAVEDRHPGDRS